MVLDVDGTNGWLTVGGCRMGDRLDSDGEWGESGERGMTREGHHHQLLKRLSHSWCLLLSLVLQAK